MSDPPACGKFLRRIAMASNWYIPFVGIQLLAVSPLTLLIIRLPRSCIQQDKMEMAHVNLCAKVILL
jgi:hypothetical protein